MLLPNFVRKVIKISLKHSSKFKVPTRFLLTISDVRKNTSIRVIAPDYFIIGKQIIESISPEYNYVTTLRRNKHTFHNYHKLAVTGVHNNVWYKYTDEFKTWILTIYSKKLSIQLDQVVYVRSYPSDQKLLGVVIGINDFYITVYVPSIHNSLCVTKKDLEKII